MPGVLDPFDELERLERAKAAIEAEQAVLLGHLATRPDPSGKNWVREQLACILHTSCEDAGNRLAIGDELRRLPDTLAAMRQGVFGWRHAEKLASSVVKLSDEDTATVEARVLRRAGEQTYSQFAQAVRRAVAAVDTRTAEQAAEDSRAGRRIVFTPQNDALGEIWAQLPYEQVRAIEERVRALADTWKGHDERTADQRRADAFVQLCLATPETGGGLRPLVNITISLDTLLAVREHPADLDGETLPAALARAVANDPTGTWRRIVTDPIGQVLDIGRKSYEPTAAITDHVTHRDPTCRFPVCNRRARTCELDHVIAWADLGPTADWNLIPLCPRHHHLKHEAGWRIKRSDNGTITWTDPDGRIFIQEPDPPPN
jgi:hypothetical protein